MPPIPERVLDLTIQVQQIPAPTFAEAQRGRFVHDLFLAEGLRDVQMDPIGNVFARMSGNSPAAAPVVVSAHLDTVFPQDTPLDIRRVDNRIYGPGIGDNSAAVAGLLGLRWTLQERSLQLPGDLWLVANVGEEGLGDLNGMRAVVDRFGDRPAAYIVLEGTALGHIYHRGLRVRRYQVRFETEGGHSWGHFGRTSAIHEMGRFITAITRLDIPSIPRTTYNVGVIEGGTSINTIAPYASLQLDLRSESGQVLEDVIRQVEEISAGFASETLNVRLDVIGDRPGGELPADHPLVTLAAESLQALDIMPHRKIGSTDANVPLSRGLPAICIGITKGGGGHTVGEYIIPGPFEKGLQHIVDVVLGAYRV